MEPWQALILGIVEGLTEYLPVSSTGHLILAQKAMGIGTQDAQAKQLADAYAICIQSGAILAVLGLYAGRVKQMTLGFLGRDPGGLRLGINILVAFFPAVVIGLALNDVIEEYLFGLWPVVGAWFVGGAAILAVAFWRKRRGTAPAHGKSLTELSWQLALVIGIAQCIAMWPGTSRSLITIVGGVLVGLSLAAAVEFSFLLGVLTLLGATFKKAVLDELSVMVNGQPQEQMMALAIVDHYGIWPTVIGSVAALVSAVVAVKWMVAYLRSHGLEIFGYYRVVLAVVVAALLLLDVIAAT